MVAVPCLTTGSCGRLTAFLSSPEAPARSVKERGWGWRGTQWRGVCRSGLRPAPCRQGFPPLMGAKPSQPSDQGPAICDGSRFTAEANPHNGSHYPHTHTHTLLIYTHIVTHTHTNTHFSHCKFTQNCTDTCTQTHTYTLVSANLHTHTCTHTRTHTHTQSHSHKNTHRHIYTHTFTSLHHFSTRTPHRYKANCLSSAIFRFPFFSLKEGTMISFSHIRKITLKPLTLAK